MSHEETLVAEAIFGVELGESDLVTYGVTSVALKDSLLQVHDVIEIRIGGNSGYGTMTIRRGERKISEIPLVDVRARWGLGQKAAGDDGVVQIEYNNNSHPKCGNHIYGNIVVEVLKGGTPEPIVGVWGAETPPPGTTEC
jgi:hypothetical protein